MTLRAIVQDGFIVINTRGELPDGTRVRVVTESRPSRKAGPTRARKKQPISQLPAIGMWKDRADWKGKSTLRIAQELREKALGRRRK